MLGIPDPSAEMMRPVRFHENLLVIDWGLSLEHPVMIRYGINNILQLMDHKVNPQSVNSERKLWCKLNVCGEFP